MDRNFLHDILPWGLLVEGQCPKVTRLAGIGLKLPANGSQVQEKYLEGSRKKSLVS
jgi:hypothetical protein